MEVKSPSIILAVDDDDRGAKDGGDSASRFHAREQYDEPEGGKKGGS